MCKPLMRGMLINADMSSFLQSNRDVLPGPRFGVAPSGAVAYYIEPARGAFRSLLDLSDDDGLVGTVFWNIFVICETCDRVMLGRAMKDHICLEVLAPDI